jgi:thiol-disulfide isomerase/thioredoxin
MFERSLVLILFLAGIFFLYKRFFAGKPNRVKNILSNIDGIKSELPTIIYFWTEQCSQCLSMQNPALLNLKKNYNKFNLISYNAYNEEVIVKKLNIKTVPATAIIDSERNEVKFINNGFASEALLTSQLKKVQ